MTRIAWDNVNERDYELGIDRAVLNVQDYDLIPWNGITSIEEAEAGATLLNAQFDGSTYANLRFGGEYQAQVTTFTFPDYLDVCLGYVSVFPGITLTAQSRVQFNLSYRSMINQSTYKLHFVYNAIATQTKSGAKSIDDGIDPQSYELVITATAPKSSIFRPTAHMVVYSNEVSPSDLTTLENMLYGTTVDEPQFPAQSDLISIF